MGSRIRRILDTVVREIEASFPGTVAAYDGFVEPRCGSADAWHVEVFNLPADRRSEFNERAVELGISYGWENDLDLIILGFTERETAEHFQGDLDAIRLRRAASETLVA